MSEGVKFDIGDKAEALYFSVFDLTTSRQHYPVKFRRLADTLQRYALNIHSDVMDANSFRNDSPSQRQKRFDYQTGAITYMDGYSSGEENGLLNRQAAKAARGFDPLPIRQPFVVDGIVS